MFAVSHFVVNAQDDSLTKKLDDYLMSANKMYKFNGTALIARHGKILLEKAYGKKDFTKNLSNDTNTIFQIGSVTKQFTATVVLKLQEEGKLSVNDKLDKYFPQFKYANEITLENLLTHTSGIYDYVRDIDDEDSAIVCHPVDKQLVLDVMFKHDLDFKPGSAFRYCNSGYYLLGIIIEKVTGESYEQNVHDIIFGPLQMTHSLFDFKHSADTDIAIGYQSISEKEQREAIAWRWDSGLPKSPLFAESETNFYLKVINARIEFLKDASGNITELIAHYSGKNEVCKKVNGSH
jgi:CubicO group peptidase (beta-lactamase class C family)